MNWALKLIQNERARQRVVEGWTDKHDDGHTHEELARAAMCYVMPNVMRQEHEGGLIFVFRMWPWDWSWWKPTPDNRMRELVKAGALIVAEMERLDRKAAMKSYPT